MTAITSIQPQFVDYIPERIEPGILYISRRFLDGHPSLLQRKRKRDRHPAKPRQMEADRAAREGVARTLHRQLESALSVALLDHRQPGPLRAGDVPGDDRRRQGARSPRRLQLLAHKPEGWLRRIGRSAAEAWAKFKELASIWWR